MRIRVKLFATLSRLANVPSGTPLDIDLPEEAAVGDLLDRLGLPRHEVRVVFVNGRARPNDWPLRPGDEVGIFPPIGGG